MVWKNYELTEEQQKEVDQVLKEGQEKYKSIAHIIMEGPGLTDEQMKVFEEDLED